MNNILDDDLFATHSMGGIINLHQAGIYHNNLKIVTTKYGHIWHILVKDEIQKGVLKIKGVFVYNYVFNKDGFKVQKVANEIPNSDWFDINIIDNNERLILWELN